MLKLECEAYETAIRLTKIFIGKASVLKKKLASRDKELTIMQGQLQTTQTKQVVTEHERDMHNEDVG